MKERYRADLKAHVLTDDSNRVRMIRHSQEYWESPTGGGLPAATTYLRNFAPVYEIAANKFDRLESKVAFLEPLEQGEEYRLSEEKQMFDAYTYGFYQTYLNVPVWQAGLKVTVKQGPSRVVQSEDTTQTGINVEMPSRRAIDQFRKLFLGVNAATTHRRALMAQPDLRATAIKACESTESASEAEGEAFLKRFVDIKGSAEKKQARTRLIRGRFWIYRYDTEARLPEDDDTSDPNIDPTEAAKKTTPAKRRKKSNSGEVHSDQVPRLFDIPDVNDKIQDGSCYMVAEMTFEISTGGHSDVWQMLMELDTNSILYLRPLSAHVNGYVFEQDPITSSGTTAPDSASNTATLNAHRNDVLLQNLDAAVGGQNALSGTYAEVTQSEGPDISPPTEATGADFDYNVRTNDFASVSGYFHVDRIFRTMEDLGFNVPTYMANTVFPIPVDIRCFNSINAHCVGDGMGGIGHTGYGLMDTTDTTNPLGRACDPRVHLHEVLGHGILYEAVGSANMGFVHSAGDALSLIYFDPDSQCRGLDGTPLGKPGDLRFTYVPWHPTLNRRCDRDVAGGWAWNGSRDNGQYGSEEILATTLFNFYRSIGGDHPNLGRRQFASRMAMYLILRAIGNLTPATNPQYAREFASELMATDALNWTSEGIFGGAYQKVIRWAFEQQGEYQTPLVTHDSAADGTITSAGDPPDVDVYIDDGRGGEYPFQHVHWHTTTVWNRRLPDDVDTHQEPELGSPNYAYVKIRNRGTQQAQNVVVYGYHTKPGAGLNWPADFEAFNTASINVGTVNANNTEEVIVGPFEWTPNINTYGHDCMLMVVTADGDAANIDNFTAGETIAEWRLVPNDNNVAQRNVNPVPGAGGEAGLMAGLNGKSFYVGNPDPGRGRMSFDIHLPALLRDRGWRLELEGVGNGFTLASGAKREVHITLHPGQPFTRDAVEASHDRDIRIDVLSNGDLIGGMTYRLDPDISKPWNGGQRDDRDCVKQAQQLADCLGIKQDIDKVCVKEIIVGLKVSRDDCC